MKSLKVNVCRNCLFCSQYASTTTTMDEHGAPKDIINKFERYTCKRYPTEQACWDADEGWCGEFAQAWMPIGEPKGRGAEQVQMFAHRRLDHTFAYMDAAGNAYTEEEYNARD